jgi:threonine/homoserine/homoserine lactone efflux protein
MPLATDILPALVFALCVAIPFGPISMMCVQRTMAFGLGCGFATGMGASTAHALFGCLAQFGAAAMAELTFTLQAPLRIAGGLVLVFMGLRTLLTRTHGGRLAEQPNLLTAYTSSLLLATTNPLTLMPYIALASANGGKAPSATEFLALPIGAMLGSAFWYFAVVLSTNAIFRTMSGSLLDWLNRIAGILLMAFGATLCARSV